MIFKLFSDSDSACHLTAGQKLFSAGESAEEIFFVLEGKIDLVHEGKVVESLLPGSVLGELAMLDNGRHAADAIAECSSVIVSVEAEQFRFLVEQTPYFAIDVMKAMAERIHSKLPE